jgi:hypothetical protein
MKMYEDLVAATLRAATLVAVNFIADVRRSWHASHACA